MSPPVWTLVVLAGLCLVAVALWLVTRRRLALARRDNAALRTMVARRMERPNVFSHEVRTPLALIHGATELLLEETPGPLTDHQREFLETIADNTAQMSGLADNLLTEARVQSQLLTLHRTQVEVRALMRRTVADLRRFSRIPVELVDTGRRITVEADPNLLRQALWNLVGNAVRHAGDDACVSVEVGESEDTLVIAVSDDGAGMSDADRELLFRPFSADLRDAGDPSPHGTGLGMMVTQQIVAAHGGRVLVDTITGRGTTVFCTLPVRAPQEVP